ncbi:hypothetical protein CYMTET_20319 [Cymbomonas tetramitiformis]|uniref:Uncharacterized protein n=1 Tax=Cymbomonas tetramitiformis TaxID=36881 RepID=A0AAE0L4F1_9CHLO|nr:hypothetical protein CYMTET_20319 [Cymbomonas tetramitiformis]
MQCLANPHESLSLVLTHPASSQSLLALVWTNFNKNEHSNLIFRIDFVNSRKNHCCFTQARLETYVSDEKKVRS